jgi:hypothetical protein
MIRILKCNDGVYNRSHHEKIIYKNIAKNKLKDKTLIYDFRRVG